MILNLAKRESQPEMTPFLIFVMAGNSIHGPLEFFTIAVV